MNLGSFSEGRVEFYVSLWGWREPVLSGVCHLPKLSLLTGT